MRLHQCSQTIRANEFRISGALSRKTFAFQDNAALRVLNMRMNGVATEGAGFFSHLLARNRVLIEVDLSQNRIYDKGYGYLAKMVVKNENLSRLSVSLTL